MRFRLPALSLLLVTTLCACSSGNATRVSVPVIADPPASSLGVGDLSRAQLLALLLASSDLPGQPLRREFAGVDLTTQAAPQLALCRPVAAVPAHQLASVLAKSGKPGTVQVFEIVSAFPTAAGARAAYDQALQDARGCGRYAVAGTTYTLAELAPVPVASADAAFHYRLTTPDVIGGDVRTLARRGRFLVLLSGFGAPPAGQSILEFQRLAIERAVVRLT